MKLDYRIIDGKKPLDCYDADIAENFIGKKGYFSNSLGWYSVLKSTWDGTLDKVESQEEQCFYDGESEGYFHYFLPAEWVKEVKYRPLTKDEFMRMFNNGVFGQWITMKSIITESEYYMQVTGCHTSELGITYICLGSIDFSLETLFKDFQWKDSNGNWRVFGVEV